MRQAYTLGIDVGTGGTKTLLLAESGVVAGTTTVEHELLTPRPLHAEQRPDEWWDATCRGVRVLMDRVGVRGDQVDAVGLTGQMHGLVSLDGGGRPLRPAILWNDQRTAAECDLIHERLGRDTLIMRTGKPVMTGFTAPKILWLQRHEPQVHAATRHVLLPKDYVRYRLGGVFATDVADASGTSLLDIERRAWADDIVSALDIPASWLPSVTESPAVSAAVSDAGALATGLRAGTPIVGGAGDQAAEALGCGIATPGVVSMTIGTSGVVFAAADHVPRDPTGRMHGFCHAVPGTWHVMGVMLSAGGSLRWLRATIGGASGYDQLVEAAARVPAGSEGLLFLPYLSGERTPHADPLARGAFVGLTLRHTSAHLVRAVLEGVAFGLRDNLELVRGVGLPVDRVRCSGGGARSALGRQILSDVCATSLSTVGVVEGAAYGAAILAAVGARWYASVPDGVDALVSERERTRPGTQAALYADAYERFRTLYPALKETFHATPDA